MHSALPPSMTMLQCVSTLAKYLTTHVDMKYSDAWNAIMTTDPLVDSDDELGDDDTRLDYCMITS